MDIFEDLDTTQQDENGQPMALKQFNLKSNLKGENSLGDKLTLDNFTVEYSNGDVEDSTETQAFSADAGEDEIVDGFSDRYGEGADTSTFTSAGGTDEIQIGSRILDRKDYIAEITDLKYSKEKECYVATVKALKTGTTVVTVRTTVNGQEYSASFSLTVTANFTVYSNPAEIQQELYATSDEITLYAVPTALAVSNSETSFVGSADEEDIETFSSGSETVDMISDIDTEGSTEAFSAGDSENQNIAVYADTNPSKNLASLMTWKITADPEGAVDLSEVYDSKFTVTSEAVVPVTLTVQGTFTYQNVEYTSYTWINVTTTEAKKITWNTDHMTITLGGDDTDGYTPASTKEGDLILTVPAGCLASDLSKDDFIVTATSVQSEEADSESMERASTNGTTSIASITGFKHEVGSETYEITVTGSKVGSVTISVSALGADKKTTYDAVVTVEVLSPDGGQAVSTDSSNSDAASDDWSDNSTDSSDFTSDNTSDWGDENDNTVDIIPNESQDDFSAEEGSWESGDNGF